jgi:hypothetical protein
VHVLPLTADSPLGGAHTVDDFRMRADELRSGRVHYGALWNARPVLIDALGERVDELLSDQSLSELRDAALRGADPLIALEADRVGEEVESEAVGDLRDREIHRWQALTGKVLADQLEPASSYTCFVRIEAPKSGPLAFWRETKRLVAEAIGKYGQPCDAVFARELQVDAPELAPTYLPLEMTRRMCGEHAVTWQASKYISIKVFFSSRAHIQSEDGAAETAYRVTKRPVLGKTAEYPVIDRRSLMQREKELA